jgi:hypothetical protein
MADASNNIPTVVEVDNTDEGAQSSREGSAEGFVWTLLPTGDDAVVSATVAQQQEALTKLSDALRRITHFNNESTRLIPGLANAFTVHAKDLSALQRRIALLETKAARCRERALALAVKNGVDVTQLRLHNQDQVPDLIEESPS